MSEKCRFRVVTVGQETGDPGTAEGHRGREGPGGHRGREGPGGQGERGETSVSLQPPQLGVKRRHSDDGVGGREELWSLHDVIFTGRVQSVRVGRVVKIDGLFAAVHFPVKSDEGRGEEGEGRGEPMEEGEGVLDRCRLLRKDDLVVSVVLAWQHLCVS